MPDQIFFALEVMANGLMVGVMSAPVARARGLIFKASASSTMRGVSWR